MLAADFVILLIPLWIALGLLFLVVAFGLLARVQNGRYVRPLVVLMMKVPILKRLLTRANRAAIERSNPELASAMRKLEPHAKHLHDPQRAQKAMSSLTREERAALIQMQDQQGVAEPEAMNRQMRRRLEKQKKQSR
jgi:hypothetical protein